MPALLLAHALLRRHTEPDPWLVASPAPPRPVPRASDHRARLYYRLPCSCGRAPRSAARSPRRPVGDRTVRRLGS